MRKLIATTTFLAITGGAAADGTIIEQTYDGKNGLSSERNTDVPLSTTADDFVISDKTTITAIWATFLVTIAPPPIDWEFDIYAGDDWRPGDVIVSGSGGTATDTGDTTFGLAVYIIHFEEISIDLEPDTYWLGVRAVGDFQDERAFWGTANYGGPVNGHQAVLRSLFFGYGSWIRWEDVHDSLAPTDVAFTLYGNAGSGVASLVLTSSHLTFGSTDNPPIDVANLIDDDDVDQILRSQFGFSAFERNLTEIVIEGNDADATNLVSINTRDGSDTTNVVAKVKARNYTSNAIVDLAQYNVSFPSDDTPHSIPVSSTDFIGANGDVEVRLRYVAPATFTPLGFTVGLDQVEVMVE